MADRFGPREPRSLRFYLALSLGYGALGYWLIQWFYTWEMAHAGLLPRGYDPSEIFLSTFTAHLQSFLAWLGL